MPRASPGDLGVELVPWHQSVFKKSSPSNERLRDGTPGASVLAETPVPETMQRAMFEGLPPTHRREARERYDALVTRLLTDMRRVKQVLGRAIVADSVAEQIRHAAWVEGDPGLLDRIEQVETAAVEKYAKFLMVDTANKQREKDYKKVANDWHGHYNA